MTARWILVVLLTLYAPAVEASFHLVRIEQFNSNAEGTVQFVVLHVSSGADGEGLWSRKSLRMTGLADTSTFTFTKNLPSDTEHF